MTSNLNVETRANIKFCVNLGHTPTETLRLLEKSNSAKWKAKVSRSGGKHMFVFFADRRGMILQHRVPEGQTVNADYYSKDVSILDFLSFPSPTKLHNIGRNIKSLVRQELVRSTDDIDKTVSTLIRISTVLTETDTQAKQAVCDCADDILQEVFHSNNDNRGVEMANAYLVYMGILKGEDKKYRPPSDITGPLILLEHIVKQKYCPHQAKKIFSAFMDKPHPLLNKSMAITSKLLQTLYS